LIDISDCAYLERIAPLHSNETRPTPPETTLTWPMPIGALCQLPLPCLSPMSADAVVRAAVRAATSRNESDL